MVAPHLRTLEYLVNCTRACAISTETLQSYMQEKCGGHVDSDITGGVGS